MARIPVITIQHDYTHVLSDVTDCLVPQEDFWVSCYVTDRPSVHGRVRVTPAKGGDVELEARNGVRVGRVAGSKTDLLVSAPSLFIPPTYVQPPRQSLPNVLKGRILSVDVSPTDNGLWAAAGEDGQVVVGEWEDGGEKERLRCRGHVGDVTSTRFFPSGEVILTTSSDLSLRIFSARDGSNPRTLRGHRRGVTDSGIISRGRNVVSSSMDGTLRLWDVSSGKSIRAFGTNRYSPAYRIAVGRLPFELNKSFRPPDGDEGKGLERASEGRGDEGATVEDQSDGTSQAPVPAARDEREVETEGKVMLAALGSGEVEVFDLDTKTRVALVPACPTGAEPLHALSYDEASWLVATGSRTGLICLHDARQMSSLAATSSGSAPAPPASLLTSFRRNEACINDLSFSRVPFAIPSPSLSPDSLSAEPQAAVSVSASDVCHFSLLVATSDGLPCALDLSTLRNGPSESGPRVVREFAGWDVDGVESVRVDGRGRIVMGGADGTLRRY